MSDQIDPRLRELTYRLVNMAPEAPPFPEEPVTQINPENNQPPQQGPRSPWTIGLLAAAAVIVVVGIPVLLLRSSSGDVTTSEPPDAITTIASETTLPPDSTEAPDTTVATETTAAPETTTTTAETTTSTSATTTTLPPESDTGQATVYLFDEADPSSLVPGPVLVSQTVPSVASDNAEGYLESLLAFGSLEDVETSEIPKGTTLLGLSVADGVATVDLSGSFDDGGGTASMFGRLAQIVFTATQFPDIDSVLFMIDGEPVEVFSGEGIVLDGPQTRENYTDVLPLVFLDSPANGTTVLAGTITVTGIANAFEATVSYEVVDLDGNVIDSGFTTASCGTGCWGDFEFTVRVDVPDDVDEGSQVLIRVFENSANDGSVVNLSEHIVTVSALAP